MTQLPTFLVLGVAKAGTTALYHHLRAHPGVYMSPVKEPGFFSGSDYGPEALAAYRALFSGVQGERAVGEASPSYLHHPDAPARIAALLPDVKLVVLLRQPVRRAVSHYFDMLNAGAFPYRPFEEVFREKMRHVEAWADEPFACYGFRLSFYHDALRRYLDHFPRERLRVYLFEDFRAAPGALLADLYAFLGVDPGFRPDLEARHNPTHGVPRSRALHRTVMQPNALKAVAQRLVPAPLRRRAAAFLLRGLRTGRPTLPDALRDEFTAVYRDDILKTQALLGRDLSRWLP